MKPFLKQVAEYYYNKGEIGKYCFVFPNRRSMAFFMKWVAEAVASAAADGRGSRPVVAPRALTINDFFFQSDDKKQADRVTLLLELYESYKKLNPKAEPLDEFIFWGDIILGDFNDVLHHMTAAVNFVEYIPIIRPFRAGCRLVITDDNIAFGIKLLIKNKLYIF